MDTFEKDIFGEVPCSEFIAQFKGVLLDREGEEKEMEGKKSVVEAARYCSSIEEIFKKVGGVIEE